MGAESPSPGRQLSRRMLGAAGTLAAFAVAGAGLVALTADATRERIAANERAYLLRSLNDVVPASAYDNDLFNDTIEVVNPELLGTAEPVTAYRARRNGRPVAVILNVVAPDGYSGPIRLVVGIDADGAIRGVRVVSHRETPGLGDDIEAERSDWILAFDGKRLESLTPQGWGVRRDGGYFDQFTGATVTPRAVVKAVHNALIYFEAHRERLFEAGAGTPARDGGASASRPGPPLAVAAAARKNP